MSSSAQTHPYHVSPETLTAFYAHFPDDQVVLAALEEATSGHLSYMTLANLAALADHAHAPDLAKAVLEIFNAMTSGNKATHAPTPHDHRRIALVE